MRTQILALLSLLVFALPAAPQIKLTTKTLNQKYCPGDIDLDSVVFDLELKFKNESNQKLLLSRDHSQINEMIVWKNDNGTPREKELDSYLEWMYADDSEITPEHLDTLFVVLLPGESYKTKTEARLFILREGRSKIGGSIGNGDKFLQVNVSDSYPTMRSDFLRERWKDKGSLWTKSIVSEPMKFTVLQNRTIEKCS